MYICNLHIYHSAGIPSELSVNGPNRMSHLPQYTRTDPAAQMAQCRGPGGGRKRERGRPECRTNERASRARGRRTPPQSLFVSFERVFENNCQIFALFITIKNNRRRNLMAASVSVHLPPRHLPQSALSARPDRTSEAALIPPFLRFFPGDEERQFQWLQVQCTRETTDHRPPTVIRGPASVFCLFFWLLLRKPLSPNWLSSSNQIQKHYKDIVGVTAEFFLSHFLTLTFP